MSPIPFFYRRIAAICILGISISMAIYVALPGDSVGVKPPENQDPDGLSILVQIIDALNRLEIAHLLAHVTVFGVVAFLVGEWGIAGERGSARQSLLYALWGGILMEIGQIIVGYSDDTFTELVFGSVYDLGVDMFAAGVVVKWLAWRHRRLGGGAVVLSDQEASPRM